MRELLAMEVFIVAISCYLVGLFGLSLLIGQWTILVMVPTLVPAVFCAGWLGERLVPRR